ncbi:Xaa-Pro dipeptidase [Pseudoteredinibacter isoporae]|uniref:Xaa-Pro dipeptidase n=1 Tax=Pseudoteredinibacter isoporae TaxID=570281 RepID=A0A7X0JR67_9GAMM|nr:Xaa-Pro dipeptidase [Pseudoteredinibacter isoporae]NHO85454.1 Xaa-Pro dipeptidase [Pseudoteredinibacter isoporae]NIB26094.1 Xaa-Pro dipeptidase [Pseudoteredinibacter isoporae]
MNFEISYGSHLAKKLERTQAYLQRSGQQALLISSGVQEPIFQDDYYHSFVVNPFFKEWLPLLNVPNCYLLIRPSGRPSLFFHKPVDIWHKVSALPEDFWTMHFDILEYAEPQQLKTLLTALGGPTLFIGLAGAIPDLPGVEWLHNDSAVLNHLKYYRARKSEYERQSIELANQQAAKCHTAAKEAFMAGASEFEINKAYIGALNLRENDLPYGNIIALNENAAILHYTHLQLEELQSSRSFLIDAGFSVNGYAADISRTYCREQSEAGACFQSLIDELDKAQLALIDELEPGMHYLDAHKNMHRRVGDILHTAGILKIDGAAALAEGITSKFLPHGLGHLLGVQVHDLGGWQQNEVGDISEPPAEHPYLRLNRELEEDMVITVEPGIYFIEPLLAELQSSSQSVCVNWELLDRLRPFGGIRIEDNVAISAKGNQNYTRKFLP